MTVYPYQEVWDRWRALAQQWATARGNLSVAEILATVVEESSGNPNAMNPGDPSFGLMGISNPIGNEYAQATGEQLYDPNTNIKAGSGFQSFLKGRYQARFPLGAGVGWIQAFNLGAPRFLAGERVPGYEASFLAHRAAFETMASATPQP